MLHLFRSHLSLRLAALLLLASLLPVLGGAFLSLRLVQDQVHREAERRHGDLAELCASLVAEAIGGAEKRLLVVARLLPQELSERKVGAYSNVNELYRSTVEDWLEALAAPQDVFLELNYFGRGLAPQTVEWVANGQNDAWGRQRREVPDYPVQQRVEVEHLQQSPLVNVPLTEGRPLREPQLTLIDGTPTLRVSVPVQSNGAPLGVLVAYMDFGGLNDALGALADDGYAVQVADGEGTLLADLGPRGEDLVGVRAGVPSGDEAGWTASIRERRARVEEPLVELRRQAYSWTGVAAVLAVALSLLFSTRITRPVAVLRRAAEEMERGNLKTRAGLERPDEIGQLGTAFDRMAAALDQLDEAKSEFVGNVSHELRTPLTSMRLSVANLLDGVVGEVDERQRATLARVRRDLDRMIALVDELLEMARLEAGAVEPRREPLDLAALARECAESVAPAAQAKGVVIGVEGRGEARADRQMMRRVITNLVDNAVKFSPRDGRVRIEVADGLLRVADQGPGVQAEGIFEKFRQGREDGVKNAGVGLGLAIVKKLVDLHGGRVRVESDGGAVFVVELGGGAA